MSTIFNIIKTIFFLAVSLILGSLNYVGYLLWSQSTTSDGNAENLVLVLLLLFLFSSLVLIFHLLVRIFLRRTLGSFFQYFSFLCGLYIFFVLALLLFASNVDLNI